MTRRAVERLAMLVLALAACDGSPKAAPSGAPSVAAPSSAVSSTPAETSATATASATTSSSSAASASASAEPLTPCVDLAPGKAPAPPLGDPRYLHGVDASTPAAWKTIKEGGYVFAFAQAALGGRKNAHFDANWRAMKACGFVRGAYHFLTPREDGAALARVLIEALGDDRGELPPTIDLEKPPSCEDECCDKPCSHWQGLVRSYLAELKKAGIEDVLVYLVEPFFNQCLCGTRELAGRPLFLAAWPKFDWPERVATGGFGRWTFYQHKGNVLVGGGVIDLNAFRGSEADLAALRPR
jgi:GH25 family lysozyme M1 (1,4-beta-N-acetylmuramidase)